MSELVERVARALEDKAMAGGAFPPWSVVARSAIAAMEEPTTAMMEVGAEVAPYRDRPSIPAIWPRQAAEIWRAMVAEALK